MGQSIHLDGERFVFESQVRECFGRCAYTHKTHEKMAERSAARLWRLKWTQIVLSALVSGGAVGVIFQKESPFFSYATAALAILLLILNSYSKDLDPGQLAQKHRSVASDIWDVRESYLSLLTDIRDVRISLPDLRERRDALQARLHEIYQGAPNTDGRAYGAAQTALKDNEELTFSEKELDVLLPKPLRRSDS